MRTLFVTPVEHGSGETITAVHMAERLVCGGDDILFLASPFARGFIAPCFPDRVSELTASGPDNAALWHSTVASYEPDVIVFADYPLLFFSAGVSPLAREPGWLDGLRALDARIVTLDHSGFAQRPTAMFFGPAHLSLHYEELPSAPDWMEILVPCPMHEPSPLAWRKGTSFRYWDVPLRLPAEARREVRARYLARDGDLLVFYPIATWAWKAAELHGLPFFSYLPQILGEYLAPLSDRVVVVSVNNGSLLPSRVDSALRIVNENVLSVAEYERLLLAADLMLTDNMISITLGRAVCSLKPCAVLTNSYRLREVLERVDGPIRDTVLAMERTKLGSVFPYVVFPSGMIEELDQLRLYHDNSLPTCFERLEVFGGSETSERLCAVLTDDGLRGEIRDRQQQYVDALRAVSDARDTLHGAFTRARAS